jgi:tetratricopeptide (TPR) repeat protein
VLNSLLAGGFRGLATDLLWIKADEYSHRGQWYKLLPILKMVTFLQPNFVTAWSVGGWHIAFNLYFHSRTEEEKEKCLNEALRFLKEGIQSNPDRYELYFELGWTYFHKLKDYQNAIRYLKRAIRFPHPQFVEHLLAHAYENNGQYTEALEIWKNLQTTSSREKDLEPIVNRGVKRTEQCIKDSVKMH